MGEKDSVVRDAVLSSLRASSQGNHELDEIFDHVTSSKGDGARKNELGV